MILNFLSFVLIFLNDYIWVIPLSNALCILFSYDVIFFSFKFFIFMYKKICTNVFLQVIFIFVILEMYFFFFKFNSLNAW